MISNLHNFYFESTTYPVKKIKEQTETKLFLLKEH